MSGMYSCGFDPDRPCGRPATLYVSARTSPDAVPVAALVPVPAAVVAVDAGPVVPPVGAVAAVLVVVAVLVGVVDEHEASAAVPRTAPVMSHPRVRFVRPLT